jgi:hypothetical protein
MTKREVERRRVIEAKLDAIGYYDDGSEGEKNKKKKKKKGK